MSKSTEKENITKKTRSKKVVKQPKIVAKDAKLRKKPKYKSLRLHKRVKHPSQPIPSWWKITKKASKLILVNKKAIGWFILIYSLLYLVFVRGFASPVDIDEIRNNFDGVLTDDASSLATNFTFFSLMVSSTTSAAGEISGLYQMIFIITSALALIWLFRQQQAGNKVTIKEAFYRGMYPLVPFVIIVIVLALQTIPASIGNYLFTTVTSTGLAINFLEQFVWLLLFISLLLLTLYLISSSLIALFVVTLPDMTPKIALSKAKELVSFRRFSVMRKVIALIILVVFIYIVIVFPMIFLSADLAQFVFFFLTVVVVPFAVAYLFVLYRELL